MAKRYKAILTDFDNTLIGKDSDISKTLQEKIAELINKGYIFSIATGRPYPGTIKNICKKLHLTALQITWGGAYIVDPQTNKPLWKQTMSDETARQILTFLEEKKVYIAVEMPDNINYTSDGKSLYFFSPEIKIYHTNSLLINNVPKILIVASNNRFTEQQAVNLKKELMTRFSDLSVFYFKSVISGFWGLDITSEKATKHTAVLEYMKLLNLKPEEVVGIGDGYNDYPLLTACGLKIAMGDAPKEVKAIADFVAPTQKENGLLIALNKYFS